MLNKGDRKITEEDGDGDGEPLTMHSTYLRKNQTKKEDKERKQRKK